MAKLKGIVPANIAKLGKDIDFYFWKGVPVVRRMPHKVRQPGTERQKETWEALRFANRSYNDQSSGEREAFRLLAFGSQMSLRDLYLKMILERYQEKGENYYPISIFFQNIDIATYRVTLTKANNVSVVLSGMTSRERATLLRWREITPKLRGKRFLRRWELEDQTEKAGRVWEVYQPEVFFQVNIQRSWGLRYFTAKGQEAPGSGYGRAGLYEVPQSLL